MSCYMEPPAHLDFLVGAMAMYGRDARWIAASGEFVKMLQGAADSDPASPTGVLRMLARANRDSVSHRYSGDLDMIPTPEAIEATRSTWPGLPRGLMGKDVAARVLKAIAGYEYQACEAPTWDGSEAKSFCDSLRFAMIHSLPGYSSADWSVGSEWDWGDAAPASTTVMLMGPGPA